MSEPVLVVDRLPEVNMPVLAFWPSIGYWVKSVLYKNRGKKPPEWLADSIFAMNAKFDKCETPTHWMPMPPPPEDWHE